MDATTSATKKQTRLADCRQRRLRRPGVVARRPVARLHRARRQHADAHLSSGRPPPAASTPVTTDRYDSVQPGLEPRRPVDLFPLRPQLRLARRQPLGIAPARAVLRQADADLPRAAGAGRALAVQPADELHPADEERRREETRGKEAEEKKADEQQAADKKHGGRTRCDAGGLESDLTESGDAHHRSPGAGRQLQQPVDWTASASTSVDRDTEPQSKRAIEDAGHRRHQARARDVPRGRAELRAVGGRQEAAASGARRTILVFDAGAKAPAAADLAKKVVPLIGWPSGSIRATSGGRCSPRRGGWSATTSTTASMHGVDWTGDAERSTCRWSIASPIARELSDVLAQMVERAVGAPHLRPRRRRCARAPTTWRRRRSAPRLARDAAGGGYRVDAHLPSGPRLPDELSPLAGPASDVQEGDVIDAVNGIPTPVGAGPRRSCCATRPASRCCSA